MKKHFEKLQLEQLGRIDADTFKSITKIPIVVILDNVRSANNVGSVFRTSDAFLIEKIYLCGITATPPNKDIQKTALGAQNSVNWEYAESTFNVVEQLKSRDYTILSIEQVTNSSLLNNFTVIENKKYALVFGNEVTGVDQDVIDASDDCIEIPQLGTKHSFNISVTCGMVLWEFAKIYLK